MIHLDVTIMGTPYRLVCKEGEQATLREAVAYLDAKMTSLRDSGKVKGNDRIAVMAAISVAAEFLSVKSPQGGPLSDMSILEVKQKLSAMHTVLDSALTPQENLF
ncbi:cell division protein ZapA [Massilia sp. RP-1-19]|uniref:Cell division protein ZapA n=1 Tax=Massilia polaris TaxID=2728846 RepID=A0A848HIQ0_9BURK|nr:cell division protein ZapA [Massilia polaris]NML61285.1 cell division protein ZapA [Massilia polaris]